jgi:hypothetical protein
MGALRCLMAGRLGARLGKVTLGWANGLGWIGQPIPTPTMNARG